MRLSKLSPLVPAVVLSVSPVGAGAAKLEFVCPEVDGLAGVTLAYDGDDRGTLTVMGALGEMTLPATKVEREAAFDGQTIRTVGIRGSGPATVPMPDRAKLESCLAAKGATPNDQDALAYQVNLCRLEVSTGAPVAVNAEVTITAIESSDAEVFVSRTYGEESKIAGGRLTLNLFPLLICRARQ